MNYQLVNLADKRLSIEVAAPKVLHYPNHAFTTRSFKRYEYLPPLEDTLWRIKTGIVRTMTWDEEGNQIAKDEMVFPTDVMMKIINKVVETLGK